MSALASAWGRARTMLADHCLHNENAVSIPEEDLYPCIYLYLLDHLPHRLEPKIRLVCRSLSRPHA